MDLLMVVQIRLIPEAFVAVSTPEWSLPGMNSFMLYQVGFLNKGFATDPTRIGFDA